MPNYKQAPKLYHNKTNFNSDNYYNLPQELMDCIFTQIDGKSGNQIKLIIVLLGTLGNGTFGVSEKWICERTGMVQQTYSKARQALVERGWVYVEDGKLYVLPAIIRYGFHYPEGISDEERAVIREKTISKCVNDVKKQYGIETKAQFENVPKAQFENVPKTQFENVPKTQSEIVYNIINNKNNSNINNNSIGISSPVGADSPIPVSGVISQAEAAIIVDPEWISPNLLRTSGGKYFTVKN